MISSRFDRAIIVSALAVFAACAPGAAPVARFSVASSGRTSDMLSDAASDPRETRFVDSVLAKLTIEEKLGQLNQTSGLGDPTGPGGAAAGVEQIRKGDVGSVLNIVGADTTRQLQTLATRESRSKIPLLFALDIIHGFRTIFPVPLGEAASWDPEIAEHASRVAAVEASAEGIAWTFAPMMDIARDPRWGRIVEGSGEDPVLGSAFAVARVRGFQGASLRDPTSIAATAKHFAAYGAAEAGRDYNIADIPERTLREVYLPPFRAAVCADVATVMASFNEVAGIPAHANAHLLVEILRREWKFDGLVVSDWTGVSELLNHGIGADRAAVGRAALEAGVDVDMVSEIYRKDLPALVRAGRIPMARLDEAVRNVLRLKYRLGLFANPFRGASAERARAVTLTGESRAAARDAARRSSVLLKNENRTLPLRKELGTIAVIGALAADTGATIGNWAGMGRAQDGVSVLDGIRRAVSARTTVRYARGASPSSDDSSGIADAVRAATGADAIVLVLGETPDMSAEAASRASIELPGAQLALARALRATGVPTVVVLMNGRPLALQWLADNEPAILETWFGGVEAGNATADLLFGDANPGGKLPVTFPRTTGQVPIYYAHKNTGRPSGSEKYTSRYIDVPFTPLFAFGLGLSYATFDISAPRLSSATVRAGATLTVDVDVANTGTVAGDEVVQLYVHDEVASVTRPVRQLEAFQRVALAPGEKKTLHFTLGPQQLAMLDVGMRRVIEPGWFTVYAGASSDAAKSARFEVTTRDGRPMTVPDVCPSPR